MKSRRTKKTLISSMVSLVLCLAMLVGSTLAWFTDTINVTADLKVGTLKVALQKYIDDEYKNVGTKDNDADYTESTEPVFGGTNWTPNQTEVYYLAVSNEGKLAFNYDMQIKLEGDMTGALQYAIIDGLKADDPEAEEMDLAVEQKKWDQIVAKAGEQTGLVEEGELQAAPYGHLEAEAVDYFALVLHMDENAGNEYQGTYFDAKIVVNARQVSYVQADGEEDPFAGYTTTKVYDFENDFVVHKDNGVQPVQGTGGKVTKETEANGNNYLSIKCLDDPKQDGFPKNFRAGFLKLDEGVTNEQVLAYSFDIKLINEETYLYIGVPGGIKLQDGALWFEKSLDVDRENPANMVKFLDLVPGQWHNIIVVVNFTAGEVSYWADGVKSAEVATRTGLTVPSQINFNVSPHNYPATPDKTADIEVGVDNFTVMVPPYVDPFEDYEVTKSYDFENDFVVHKDNGVGPLQGTGGKVTKETEEDGNNYLSIKCLDDPKQDTFPKNFRAEFLKLNEGVTNEQVLAYSFDIKLINEETYLYIGVPGGIKLQDGALWFEKSMDVDREDTANQVKLLTLNVGEWHHIGVEVNFVTGEVYYYADGVKNPTPATRTGLTVPSQINFNVSHYNYPATPDKTADIEVGIDNFEVNVPPYVDPFEDYKLTKSYDFENDFVVHKDNGVQPVQGTGGKVTKETEEDGNNYLSIKCLDDPKQDGFPKNFRAGFLNLSEGVTEEQVLAYSFDIKLINEETYLYIGVPGGIKLQDGALWFEKKVVDVDREDPANVVKLLTLDVGEWHHIGVEVNFTTGEVYYYADGVKNPTPATRTGLTVPGEIRFSVAASNFPATPDKTADIEVGIDNFEVKIPTK